MVLLVIGINLVIKDGLVASIRGSDADDPPNSWMEFILHEQYSLDKDPNCPNELFKLETDIDHTTGLLKAAVDLIGCWGKYNVTIQVYNAVDYIEQFILN